MQETEEQPTVEQDEARLAALVAQDLQEFARDTGSAAARIYLAYQVGVKLGMTDGNALSTGILVGGGSIFGRDTDWMSRTRQQASQRLLGKGSQ